MPILETLVGTVLLVMAAALILRAGYEFIVDLFSKDELKRRLI